VAKCFPRFSERSAHENFVALLRIHRPSNYRARLHIQQFNRSFGT
jgi:hypothetical protein